MKTNFLNNFRGQALGALSVLTVSLSACGGAGGDDSIERSPLKNVPFSAVTFVSPYANQQDVCPTFTLRFKIPGIENCNSNTLNLDNAIRVFRLGDDPLTSAIQFSGFDPKPIPSENMCELSGQTSTPLAMGNTYRARTYSDMVNGQQLLADYLEFRVMSQAEINANPSKCASGSFNVNTINGGHDFQATNLTDFGRVREDSTVDLSQETLDLLSSSLLNILRDSFSGYLGFGVPVYDSSPNAIHAPKITFLRDVSPSSIGAIEVYKVDLFAAGTDTPIFRRVDSYAERKSASEYWIYPWDNILEAKGRWDYWTTYIVLVKKTLSSTNGLNMPQSILYIFTTVHS